MSSDAPPVRTRARRPLNLTRVKSVIVFFAGGLTALGSALTGLGAQVAFAPMLTWMLGFGPEKAAATAWRYAAAAALAAVVGVCVATRVTMQAYRLPDVIPVYLLHGALLFLGATIGALLAAPLAQDRAPRGRRQLFQFVGILVTLFVILQTTRQSWLNATHFTAWNVWWQLALLGLAVGALTQALGLASGILMVPALIYFGGFTASQSIALSLLVITLASALPAWTYTRQGLADTTYGNAALLGGILGGFGGGLLLAHLPEKVLLYLFAVIAMFLCGRELARLTTESAASKTH
jgi:uncharacterized membrane protein YfcA